MNAVAEGHAIADGPEVRPTVRATREADESGYDPAGFEILRGMQDRHFWYLGRHRFLLHALRRQLKQVFPGCNDGTTPGGLRPTAKVRRQLKSLSAEGRQPPGVARRQLNAAFPGRRDLSAVDLGGGCGGWVKYLQRDAPDLFQELVLADPSPTALSIARQELGDRAKIVQADALSLNWRERFDVVFLLDVLEHIADDELALRNVWRALRPGGLAIIAAPALQRFWSYNDDLEGHVRRYSKADFAALAQRTGFRLRHSRYFMFLLSPLLLAQRWRRPPLSTMSAEEILSLRRRTHRIPWQPLNQLLRFIFSCESPLGDYFSFSCGASILAVMEKPAC